MNVESPESRITDQPHRTTGGGPLLVLISAPSGGGKTTLCNQLLATRPDLTRAITCTTRAPRPGERHNVDYYFLDPADFQRRVQAGEFIEHATVFGHSYGILRAELMDKLRRRRDVDVQGAATIRAQARQEPELQGALVTVFLTPPSLAILAERLMKRAADAPEEIQKRLGIARNEIAQWKYFDYLLISTTVPEDLRRIVEAEKMRGARSQPPEC